MKNSMIGLIVLGVSAIIGTWKLVSIFGQNCSNGDSNKAEYGEGSNVSNSVNSLFKPEHEC